MNSINLQMNDLSRKALDFRFKFSVNEFVEISSDLETIKSLQRGHGEWADDMIPVNIRLLDKLTQRLDLKNPFNYYGFAGFGKNWTHQTDLSG
jgi:hypothetical protein